MYVPFCKTIDDVTFQLSLRHHFWPRLKKTGEHNFEYWPGVGIQWEGQNVILHRNYLMTLIIRNRIENFSQGSKKKYVTIVNIFKW